MIYCVEDDAPIRELIVYTLKNTGFEAEGFENGELMFEAFERKIPEMILLDIMLPGENGIDILKALKRDSSSKDIPVIIITAKSTEYDKVIGLDCGADDYISKPFGMMEMVSRIRAVMRRVSPKNEKTIFECGGVVLNTRQHTVTSDEKEVSLTLKEFELLKLLMLNSGTVITRDVMLGDIWGYDFDGETRTVDVHVGTLRSKLGKCGGIIETVRGVGYKISGVISK